MFMLVCVVVLLCILTYALAHAQWSGMFCVHDQDCACDLWSKRSNFKWPWTIWLWKWSSSVHCYSWQSITLCLHILSSSFACCDALLKSWLWKHSTWNYLHTCAGEPISTVSCVATAMKASKCVSTLSIPVAGRRSSTLIYICRLCSKEA